MKRNIFIFLFILSLLIILSLFSATSNHKSSIFDYSLYADTLIYWEPEQRLTYDSIPQLNCQVWAYDSFVHILVNYDYSPVEYIKSSDYGETWSDTTRLSIRNSTSFKDLVQQDSVVYFVWSEQWPGPPVIADVDTSYTFFRRSNDYGATLDSALFLGKGWPVTIDAKRESVYIDPIVGNPPPIWGAYLSYSFDGGLNWSSYFPVSDSTDEPNIVYRNGILHFAGSRDYKIIYTRSTDLGNSWSSPTIITAPNTHLPKRPNLALGPEQNVYIAWTDNKFGGGMQYDDVMFRKSTDDGFTWGAEQRLTPDSHCDVASIDMVSQDSLIFIVWNYNGLGNPTPCSLFVLASTDCGESWRPRETVKAGTGFTINDANVAATPNYIYVLWEDNEDSSYAYNGDLRTRRGSMMPPGIEERKSDIIPYVKIFPNPFRDILRIRYSKGRRKKDIEVKIYDITGKEVMSYDLREKEKGIGIDTRGLPGGIYFIKVKAGDVSAIKKVIKIK